MGKFTVIPQDTFNALQLDAGVLLKRFNPANPVAPLDSDIICATTGGVNPTCKPTYSDFADDVDNAPKNVLEFKHLDGWDVALATTGLGTSPELIQMALGAADIVGGTKIVPRMSLITTDFKDIWWVGDKANGGFVAIKLLNALSNDGFSIQTTKNGKGQLALNLGGHVSLQAQDVVPMEIYSIDADEDDIIPDIVLSRANATIKVNETIDLRAETNPSGEEVTWSTDDSEVVTVTNGSVKGKAVGTAKVTAAMTYGDVTYQDTCNITVESAGA